MLVYQKVQNIADVEKLCLDFFFYSLMFIFLCFSCINNLFFLCSFRYEQKFYTRSSLLPSPFFYSVVNGREVIFIGGRSQTTLTRFWLFLTTYPPALTFSMVYTLTKTGHFWNTYLPRLVNVVCERPLRQKYKPPFLLYLFFSSVSFVEK